MGGRRGGSGGRAAQAASVWRQPVAPAEAGERKRERGAPQTKFSVTRRMEVRSATKVKAPA